MIGGRYKERRVIEHVHILHHCTPSINGISQIYNTLRELGCRLKVFVETTTVKTITLQLDDIDSRQITVNLE